MRLVMNNEIANLSMSLPLLLVVHLSLFFFFFFFNDTATTEIYTLSLHDALPILTVTEVTGRAGCLKVLVAQRKRGLVVIVLHVTPGAGVVTGAAVASQFAFVGLLFAMAGDALLGGVAVALAGGVAALAHHDGVRAAHRIVGILVIELLVTQLHDVCFPTQMFGVTGATL